MSDETVRILKRVVLNNEGKPDTNRDTIIRDLLKLFDKINTDSLAREIPYYAQKVRGNTGGNQIFILVEYWNYSKEQSFKIQGYTTELPKAKLWVDNKVNTASRAERKNVIDFSQIVDIYLEHIESTGYSKTVYGKTLGDGYEEMVYLVIEVSKID
jgi:hypothetical protein